MKSVPLSSIKNLTFRSGIHMTSFASKMHPRQWWESKGYRLQSDGRLLDNNFNEALPLYEGRMIDRYDASAKAWQSGRGRHAIWQSIPWNSKQIAPQFYMSKDDVPAYQLLPRLAFKVISRPTIKRTMNVAYINRFPAGNAIAGLWHTDQHVLWALLPVMNSLVYDYMIKKRCSGLNLYWHLIQGTPIPVDALNGPVFDPYPNGHEGCH